jgi:hypothetical protein
MYLMCFDRPDISLSNGENRSSLSSSYQKLFELPRSLFYFETDSSQYQSRIRFPFLNHAFKDPILPDLELVRRLSLTYTDWSYSVFVESLSESSRLFKVFLDDGSFGLNVDDKFSGFSLIWDENSSSGGS